MKKLKSLQFIVLVAVILSYQSVSAQTTIALEDFSVLNNTSWSGTLTYSDYQSGKLVPIATTMQVVISEKGVEQNIQYTYEPNKNIKSFTKIKKNGAYFGKQKIISKNIDSDGTVTIITSYKGKDDNRKATLYYTYTFNTNFYKVEKEVLFDGSSKKIFRNSYEYKRI